MKNIFSVLCRLMHMHACVCVWGVGGFGRGFEKDFYDLIKIRLNIFLKTNEIFMEKEGIRLRVKAMRHNEKPCAIVASAFRNARQ